MMAGIAASGWPDGRAAWFLGAILEDPGLALLVSGLSPYLPQGFPPRTPDSGDGDGLRGQRWGGDQRQFPLDIELLAGLLLCGVVCWGGAEWVARR